MAVAHKAVTSSGVAIESRNFSMPVNRVWLGESGTGRIELGVIAVPIPQETVSGGDLTGLNPVNPSLRYQSAGGSFTVESRLQPRLFPPTCRGD
jgi:hypothetical protein